MALRHSQQRERIYQAVASSREHPTAQMVYHGLRPELPQLSLGTVYRNLRQLAQEGRLRELDGPTARYDGALRPHSHIRCQRCGRVADVDWVEPAVPADTAGYVVTDVSLHYRGICPACQRTIREKRREASQ